jgi:hypothetical protein
LVENLLLLSLVIAIIQGSNDGSAVNPKAGLFDFGTSNWSVQGISFLKSDSRSLFHGLLEYQ